jgi:general secretion pathway protein F
MATSDAAVRFGWIAPLGVALALFALRHHRGAPHRNLLCVPLLGSILALADAARFCRALGAVSAAGMELPAGLALTARTLANQSIASSIDDAIPRLRAGEALGDIIATAAIFPPLVAQMLRLGEENGRLDAMLLRAADLLEAELERRLDRLQALLVPGLTIALGGLVALIVGSVMLALLQLNQLAN